MRLLLTHRNHYRYPRPAGLGPHTVRLRPATHAKARIETHALHIEQECNVRWQQDPAGNHLARLTFPEGTRVSSLDLLVELAVDIRPVNPFDFFVDPLAEEAPFAYPDELTQDLLPYLDTTDAAYAGGERLTEFLRDLPQGGRTVDLIVELNRQVNARLKYVIREESGVWTPEQTLGEGRASCRDSAVLLVAALRSRGLAARFVSGYLIQLTDEGMIPDEPKGVGRDVVDLHAWAEVYLPGAGWIGLDATSGLFAGEGHIPLACAARPAAASPIEGTSDVVASEVSFEMTVGRLGHEPRPTAPFTEETWELLVAAGDKSDALLANAGLALTVGGEPTFTSRVHAAEPEWNTDALGKTKSEHGLLLAHALRKRLAPGGIVLHGFGKRYPGESLPRWALDVIARTDGEPLASGRSAGAARDAALSDAERAVRAIAARLGVSAEGVQPALEDPWNFVAEEARLPVGVDPLAVKLSDPEERLTLARVLDRGLETPVGFVLPLGPAPGEGWLSDVWRFRRERLYLVPGDSPAGLRLPLRAIVGPEPPLPEEEAFEGPPDPRRAKPDEGAAKAREKGVRTALVCEVREGKLHVFLPPTPSAERFSALVRGVEAALAELDLSGVLEGYPPPRSPELLRFSVTPDPGVIEVNIPPTRTSREHTALLQSVFDAALHAGLHAEKFQLDGRQAGSGGGNHITLGGATALASPFLQRPDLLASMITFVQHHPSLSYLFSGLFVGPTSQAPRVDEARHDALYELEIALARAFQPAPSRPAPWLSDALFRNLLVDVSGNTHRTEICIDKLFDPSTPHGRQGLLELRAFEMPPHARMASAQVTLVRALVASFAQEPYQYPLVRWGQVLHDRFLLPTWLWRDFEDVLAHLERAGLGLPGEGFRVFLEHRCPVVGTLSAGDVFLELRNAIEPWNVLGDEVTATGTARYVDSSMERVEIRATGLLPERHTVIVNGHELPLRSTGVAGEYVGGVRFRAWAPPHSLHPHLGIHHPLRFELCDRWGKRSLGACAYHVWHPEGRAFDVPPLTRFEAQARRAQRFTLEGPTPWPVRAKPSPLSAEAPHTLDLRRFAIDHPMPDPDLDLDASPEESA
ncbi:MAG: transglutaminase family protein [Myxococcales bacterium]|nr:transglutaminase family protein [Myxococcales bacterium]